MKKTLLPTALVVAALAAAGSAQAATTTAKPAIVKAGQRVTLTGTGFPRNRAGQVVVGGKKMKVKASARGKIRLRFDAPRGRGQRKLVAKIGGAKVVNALQLAKQSKSSVSTAASSGQRVRTTPAVGRAGAKIQMKGVGFPASGLVRFIFGGEELHSATASGRGGFTTSFRMPPSPTGSRPVTVRSSAPALRVPLSIRSCGVRVCLPYELDFDMNHGGLKAGGGTGTGFTTFAPTNKGTGYNAGKLAVGAGLLKITTSAGIAFGTSDSQENALAVGVKGASQIVRIHATLADVPAGTGKFEQAGLWFGDDQDNYAKLYVVSRDRAGVIAQEVRLDLEVKGQQAASNIKTITGDTVALSLEVDNNLRRVAATLRVDGGAVQNLAPIRPPNGFFAANTRAGVFATHRNGPAPLVYSFDDFSVRRTGPASPPPPPAGIGDWTTVAPAPRLLLDAGGAAVGGKLYAVAGKFCCDTRRTSLFIYDPATDNWSTGPNLPAEYPGVEDPAAVGHDGKLYVFGGGTSAFTGAVTNAAVFDPASGPSGTWTSLEPLPTARSAAKALATSDGKIYVIGGLDTTGASLKSVDVYDVASNAWSSGVDMGTARSHHGAAVLGGKLYVFGGRTRLADGSGPGILRSGESFDPGAASWEPIADMPSGRRSPAVGTLQGCAQVIGGESKGGFPGTYFENEQYDPATDTWKVLTGMPTPRHGTAAATVGGTVYVAAGGPVNGSGFTDVTEAFSLPAGAC